MRRHFLFLGLSAVALSAIHCEDAVAPTAVASVRVSPAGATIAIGETATFTAEALDAGGVVLSGKSFVLTSSDAAVAAVQNTQVNPATFTAVAAGNVTITATCEGKIGQANLTVQAVPDVQVTGRVIDGETQAPIANATIEFRGYSPDVSLTTTGADGGYAFRLRPSTTFFVEIKAGASGYIRSTMQYGEPRSRSSLTMDAIPLVRDTGLHGGISGTVRSATDSQAIENARVQLYRGIGNLVTMGANLIGERTTNAAGFFSFDSLSAGSYLVFADAVGFNYGTRTGIAVGTGAVTSGQDVILSPQFDGLRVILTWGNTPRDLDSHLTGPNPSDADRFHVYYANRLDSGTAPFAGLDLDDTNGSGPETVTIGRLNSGSYRYSVQDFSNRNSSASTALGASGAKVQLVSRYGTIREWFVPHQSGTLWTVFELSGDIANPTITDRNTMGAAEDPAGIPKTGDALEDGTDTRLIEAATPAPKP